MIDENKLFATLQEQMIAVQEKKLTAQEEEIANLKATLKRLEDSQIAGQTIYGGGRW